MSRVINNMAKNNLKNISNQKKKQQKNLELERKFLNVTCFFLIKT